MKKKSLLLAPAANPNRKAQLLLEKTQGIVGDEEDEEEIEEHSEEQAPVDEEYDDEDLGGDYDAEQYFENGENDDNEDAGGDDQNDF